MIYTRRDLGKIALASVPMASAFAKVNSKFNGVQIGAITYSFRAVTSDVDELIKAMVQLGLGEAELMSNSVEAAAGAPGSQGRGGAGRAASGGPGGGAGAGPGGGAGAGQGQAQAGGQGQGQGRGRGGGRAQMTPEQQAAMQAAQRARTEELRKWRLSVSMDKFKDVRKKFGKAGIDLALLCFNMQDSMADEEIDYAFQMAKALGAKALTTSTTVSMSKRIAPVADKHKMLIGYHGHDQTSDPNQFATLESYATAFGYGKYNGVNLDIGHFTASNYDAIAFIKEHHARIPNLHVKDRKKDHGPNTPWGQGDTPIKDVLQLLRKNKYPFPANIELEYPIPQGSDVMTEMAKCLKFCKDALA
jgi:sugar phosphate isomerase/epimerase